MCAWVLSHFCHVQLFATLWTHSLPASSVHGIVRQEYWNGLPCPSPGDLPDRPRGWTCVSYHGWVRQPVYSIHRSFFCPCPTRSTQRWSMAGADSWRKRVGDVQKLGGPLAACVQRQITSPSSSREQKTLKTPFTWALTSIMTRWAG